MGLFDIFRRKKTANQGQDQQVEEKGGESVSFEMRYTSSQEGQEASNE